MKLGATCSRRFGRWAFDIGYPADMVSSNGASDEGALFQRGCRGGRRRHRAPTSSDTSSTRGRRTTSVGATLGASAQWSVLDARTRAEDSDAWAAAIHAKGQWGALGLMLQLTGYAFDADYRPAPTAFAPPTT